MNLEVASEALAQLNATVVTVENGREAVDAAAAGGFDIIFMDGSMPVMDGFAAARAHPRRGSRTACAFRSLR